MSNFEVYLLLILFLIGLFIAIIAGQLSYIVDAIHDISGTIGRIAALEVK